MSAYHYVRRTAAARDPWADFVDAFADQLSVQTLLTDDELDAMAAAYQREQIASAMSTMPDDEQADVG